jgi:hypothetical protein
MTLRSVAASALFVVMPFVQAATGSIAGTITDKDGGVIPGATITVIGETHRATATTDSSGRYRLEGVPPGRYRVQARFAGFATVTDDAVTLVSGQTTTWNTALGFGFGPSNETPTTPDPTSLEISRGVYATLFREIARSERSSRVVVVAESLVPQRPNDDIWVAFRDAPLQLRTRLEAPESARPVLLNREAFPSGVQVVRGDVIQQVFRSAPKSDIYAGWMTFESKFRTHRSVALTRVFHTDDARNAIVYFEHHCGNVCGEGTLVWLTRESGTSSWTIRGRRNFWVS